MKTFTSFNHQDAVSLLEVLIALLVMAVGVLGFAGLQMTSLNQSTAANHRVTAVLIAQDAIERMELNAVERDTYLNATWTAGTLGASPSNTGISGRCDSAGLANWHIAQLTSQAAHQLPAGQIPAEDCGFNSTTCVAVSRARQ